MLYCKNCDVPVKAKLIIDVHDVGFYQIRNYNRAGITVSPRRAFQAWSNGNYKIEIDVDQHRGHKLITTCYECGRHINVTITSDNVVIPVGGKIIPSSGVFVCERCFNKYYEGINYEDEEDEL